MELKGIITEDFVNYKLPSMFLATAKCDWKCCADAGVDSNMCQNAPMAMVPSIDISTDDIYLAFVRNDITKAVVIGGLEPFLQFEEVEALITLFRDMCESCDFVIYTGYYPDEISHEISVLSRHKNIIVKFGRYIPNDKPVYDDVLGVTLASSNQYARKIS